MSEKFPDNLVGHKLKAKNNPVSGELTVLSDVKWFGARLLLLGRDNGVAFSRSYSSVEHNYTLVPEKLSVGDSVKFTPGSPTVYTVSAVIDTPKGQYASVGWNPEHPDYLIYFYRVEESFEKVS